MSRDESGLENPNQLKGKSRRFKGRRKIRLGDSKTAPSATLNTGQVETAQSKSTTSTKLRIKEHKYVGINSWHSSMARIKTHKQNNIMAGS